MKTGAMRYWITVYSPAEQADELGGGVPSQALKVSCWAAVRVPRAQSGDLAMQSVELRTHEVETYIANGIEKDDVIEWEGGRMVVKGTRPDFAKGTVYLDCVSDVP